MNEETKILAEEAEEALKTNNFEKLFALSDKLKKCDICNEIFIDSENNNHKCIKSH